MSHEIMATDNVVLYKERAWHGLGIVVSESLNAVEALTVGNLDWEVDQWPMYATDGEGKRITLETHVANVRRDTDAVLGVVGSGWTPFQNREMAEFIDSLVEQNDTIGIESAGSIRGGAKVWFLVRGESFDVRGDEVSPYICVSNGFDGATGFRCTPTTIRVVCSNTLHMVIPNRDNEGNLKNLAPCSFSCKHTGNLKERVQQAKEALGLYHESLETHRELIDQAAAKDVNREDVQRFFLECYTRDFGGFADVPANKKERRARDKALEGMERFAVRFDKEQQDSGANAWTMSNAYTGFIQHDRKGRTLKDVEKAAENKMQSNLFGVNADRSVKAFATALSM